MAKSSSKRSRKFEASDVGNFTSYVVFFGYLLDLTETLPNYFEKIAETIGIAAIKYNILSQNRTTDITFDWDRMLSLEGNSAPYLQYAYARAKSILRNANEEVLGEGIDDPENAEEKTRLLIRLLPKFKEEIINAAQEYKVNILTNYLYSLAQEFNSFYNVVPVIKTKDVGKRKARLELVEGVSWILKNGLDLLGIQVVEEM